MSGLEKFQKESNQINESWRSRFKKILLVERKAPVQITAPIKETQQFSLDIAEDFKKLLKEKQAKLILSNQEQQEEHKMENNPNNIINDTIYGETDLPQWQQTSDESFMAMEAICNKTASDPNSTLFRYLQSEDKEEVVAQKKLSVDFREEIENRFEAHEVGENDLQKLLNELRVIKDPHSTSCSPLKSPDNTLLLDDIEAPSRFWDNTMATGETILQTSPVKMVGLLRPSTIMEEGNDESSCTETSSQYSYQTAHKAGAISEVSSCYETARESIGKSRDNLIEFDKSSLALETQTSESSDLNEQISLLDQTLAEMPKATNTSESEDSIIEILSDEEQNEVEDDSDCMEDNQPIQIKSNKFSMASTTSTSSFVFENNKENAVEKSLEFNDTMEEVEYMMKKGMEYMAAANVVPATISNLKPLEIEKKTISSKPNTPNKSPIIKQNTFVLSPHPQSQMHNHNFRSPLMNYNHPQKLKGNSTNSPKVLNSAAKTHNRLALDIKIPKFDLFKKPSGIPTPASSLRTKQQFSHIVSPIGAYVRNTSTTPLMTSLHPKNINATEFSKSTAIRELEEESKLYRPNFQCEANSYAGTAEVKHEQLKNHNLPPRRLPKKAYITSDLKKIVDERTPVTIPGGKTIQKYLDNAMLPAVVRHEGKMKTTDNYTSHIPRRADSSLADLSIVSGDVSMYTIKDARKF